MKKYLPFGQGFVLIVQYDPSPAMDSCLLWNAVAVKEVYPSDADNLTGWQSYPHER